MQGVMCHKKAELIGRPPRVRARRGEERFCGWKAKSNLTLKKIGILNYGKRG
jgi:hypothetical protein